MMTDFFILRGICDVSSSSIQDENIGFDRILPNDWVQVEPCKAAWIAHRDETIVDRIRAALGMLEQSIEVDPDIRSGVPVLRGTRFPVSRVLAELAENQTISEIADAWDLDIAHMKQILQGLSIYLDRPLVFRLTLSSDNRTR